ncbi:glutamine amidotransferase [Microvirga sp. W0021]|uniref:Glutamine amidotransferase n=1 Tax=Hohaiivirga grylli TaxID=3133970 RepID=A0ABV0BL63_9HYPH
MADITANSESDKKPVLIVLHQEASTAGRIGDILVQRGYALDIRRPRFGDMLPETLVNHTGAIIFGGPMSANDNEDFIRQEIDWISVPLRENKPFLGICLGAQMLARNLGSTVRHHTQGLNEIGYYQITPTDMGSNFAQKVGAPWPSHVYHWHSEGFECPAGAEKLVSGEYFPNQAFRYGQNAYAIQFHPEVTQDMMKLWTIKAAEKLTLPGAQDRNTQLESRLRYDPEVDRWINRFIDFWLSSGNGDGLALA